MNRFSYLFLLGAVLLFSGFKATHYYHMAVPTQGIDSTKIIAALKPIIEEMVNNKAQKMSAERKTNVSYTLSNITFKVADLSEADKAALNGVFLERNNYADRLNYASGDTKRSYMDSLARFTALDSLVRHKATARKAVNNTCYIVAYKAAMNGPGFSEAANGELFFDSKFRFLQVAHPAVYLLQIDSL